MDIRFSLAGILMLVLGFMAVLGYAIHMGYDIDCGCFGPGDPETLAFHGLYTALCRDGTMLAVTASLYLWRHKTGHCPLPVFSNESNRK